MFWKIFISILYYHTFNITYLSRLFKKTYFNNAFSSYCDGNAYLDKYVKEVDYHKYGPRINYSNGYINKDTNKGELPTIPTIPELTMERQESIQL